MEGKMYNPNGQLDYNDRRFGNGERYRFERRLENGVDVLIKRGRASEQYENLDREVLWSDFMQHVAGTFPDAHLRSPILFGLDKDETELKMEYVDLPLLCAENDVNSLSIEQLQRFVKILVLFDQASEDWKPHISRDDSNEHTPYTQVDKSWHEWHRFTKKDGLVTQQMDIDARQLVKDYAQHITPRMQNGDLAPWQIFDGDEEWIIFDAEHCSESKPRYYDLAYTYARTFVLGRSPDMAKYILTEFLSQHQEAPDVFFNAFIPVLMSRSMGMFLDTYYANQKGNVGLEPYAKDLYDRCMQRSLKALLD